MLYRSSMRSIRRSFPARRRRSKAPVGLVAALLLLALAPGLGAAQRPRDLPEHHREWLTEVELIITKAERKAFLELEKDYQRESFIRRFWESRDPDPEIEGNRYREVYYQRRAQAVERFENERDDRFRIWVLNGEPSNVLETDCGVLTWPIERWEYGYSAHAGRGFKVIFVQPAASGPFQLWRPSEGYQIFFPANAAMGGLTPREQRPIFERILREYCGLPMHQVEDLLTEFRYVAAMDPYGPVEAEEKPTADLEWLTTFQGFSTDTDEEADPLPARLEMVFPGRHQSRIVVQGRLEVDPADARAAELAGVRLFTFQLTGEVLRDDELFESFRYRFELPDHGTGEPLSMVFDRFLRPGRYRLVLKLDDQHGGGSWRREEALEVPARPAAPLDAGEVGGGALSVAAAEGDGEIEETSIELAAQGEGPRVGYVRFVARTTGASIAKVSFLLEGRPIQTKTRPPFSVELDVGSLPDTQAVRVEALDGEGRILATDEILVNPARHAFLLRLVEPQAGGRYQGEVRVRAEVQVAEGQALDRVELFLGERRVATLFQPPFVQRLPLEHSDLAFVRAVAYLEDGNSTEDLVVFNTELPPEEVEVKLVELFTTVVDQEDRVLADLQRKDFTVLEEGREQEILRFESLRDLPIHAALLIDTSASMAEELEAVRAAALGFFEQAIQPRDRAAVITFSEEPRLVAGFTPELSELAGGLAGLTAERGTALYDSLLFALQYFQGIKGQRALIVLSDGEDRRSKASLEDAASFAISTGVTVYAVSLAENRTRQARARLGRLAAETGGRSFTIDSVEELDAIYEAIQLDLRSRYLLVYQSPAASAEGFREIEVRVGRPGARARTLRGYYP